MAYPESQTIQSILEGVDSANNTDEKSWNAIVAQKIHDVTRNYSGDVATQNILAEWLKNVTIDYKHNKGFTPHVNGFYMIFMTHGPWYTDYNNFVKGENHAGLSEMPDSKKASGKLPPGVTPLDSFNLSNPHSYLNMLATDIDVPDIVEEYTSVSSRLRNSFVPSRNYFVSDFSISYIENINLDIMRYHEAWHKYMNLIKRGEHGGLGNLSGNRAECNKNNSGYFLDMPFTNAIWVAVFKPFSTEIQMLIKLMGVMPVTMPLKQVIGNRSSSKMTVLNISYKAADIFYKFYNSTEEFLNDKGMLATSFQAEVFGDKSSTSNKQASGGAANIAAVAGGVSK